jgi:glycosyltransferase involved in cell wall biosynthesis
MTRLLLLTDNYPPEMNASANRCSAHAERWVALGAEVEVVTSFPNYPKGVVFTGYRQKLWHREVLHGVRLLRVPTLVFPNSGTIKRIIDQVSYMLAGAIGGLFVPRPDAVIATSPQFFAALAGWAVASLRRRPFVLELRDLWPDSILAVGAMKEGKAIRLVRRLERFLYREADLIVTVTEGSRRTLIGRGVDAGKIVVIRNGADTASLQPGHADDLRKELGVADKIVVSYIGTLGMAHGLDVLVAAANILQATTPNVVFMAVGSGAVAGELRSRVAELNLTNVIFVDQVPHDEIAHYWHASDIALALLRDDPLFRTVTPSKVFEAMATGTPLVCNVAGETHDLIEPLGAALFVPPADSQALAQAIAELANDAVRRQAKGESGRRAASQFQRSALAKIMLEEIEGRLLGSRNTKALNALE